MAAWRGAWTPTVWKSISSSTKSTFVHLSRSEEINHMGTGHVSRAVQPPPNAHIVDVMMPKPNACTDGDALIRRGYALAMLSFAVLMFGFYTSVLSPILSYLGVSPTNIHSRVAADAHYKYFPFLVVPAGLLFVIANWVGWQYYQNS
ncbi:hypothetical protein FRC11_009035 [Ceratobasidium sp. 423]|nr:hypothetical protein FRC11_009035 [Ceratobasidium sp. 423]